MTEFRMLTLPGWNGSGPEHWQSHWERQLGCERVEQDDWLWPRRGDWMARLDDVLLQGATPAVLIAHSLGCHLVAAWASHSQHRERVRAALLVALPDLERPGLPPQLHGWRRVPRQALPCPSIAVVSDDDPFSEPARATELARQWGAEVVHAGALGHINADSRLGDWPQGQAWLQAALRQARSA